MVDTLSDFKMSMTVRGLENNGLKDFYTFNKETDCSWLLLGKEKKASRLLLMSNAATQIQALGRGYMVRKNLSHEEPDLLVTSGLSRMQI